MDIVIADEGNNIAVWRKDRRLLGTTLTERLQLVVLDHIYIIGGGERTAVDSLRLRLYQDALAVGTHDIAINTTYLRPTGCLGIEEYCCLLTRTEGIGNNALAVVRNLGIGIVSSQRRYSRHALATEGTAHDVIQTEFLTSHSTNSRHCYGNAGKDDSLHSMLFWGYLILSAARTSFSSSRIPFRAIKIRMAFTIGSPSAVSTRPSSTAIPIYHAKMMKMPTRQRRA